MYQVGCNRYHVLFYFCYYKTVQIHYKLAQFSNGKVAQDSLQSGATLLHSGGKNKKTTRDTLGKFERENTFDDLAK